MSVFSGKLPVQAWMIAPETQKVMHALMEDGGDARFVGGAVRNTLANRKVVDIDIATPLKPEQVIERLKSHEIAYVPTGLSHGTVTALVDGRPFEITTLRLDVMTFGRHAEVKFTDDWKTDASRRDFTINAMSLTMEGDIFDPFGGVEDLRLGRIRFVGNPEKRITEDFLRILRFFRFYAHFGKGNPDAEALKACAAAAKQIPRLSAERIRQETLKLLEAESCPEVWKLMLQCGVVTHFLPEATNVRALENMVALEAQCHCPAFALRRLAATLDVTPGGLKNIAQGLRLSNKQAVQLLKMTDPAAAGISLPPDISAIDVRKMVYRLGNDLTRNLLLVSAAKAGDQNSLPPLCEIATTFRAPRFPLTGEDVLKMGYPAGPDVGRVLGAIENWWLQEGFKPGRTECLKKLHSDFMPGIIG